jgi:hypothetical protein
MREQNVNFLRVDCGRDDSRLKLGNPRPTKKRRARHRVGVDRRWTLTWDNGKLFRNETEIMFFHFFRTKSVIDDSFNFNEVCENNNKIRFSNRKVKAVK